MTKSTDTKIFKTATAAVLKNLRAAHDRAMTINMDMYPHMRDVVTYIDRTIDALEQGATATPAAHIAEDAKRVTVFIDSIAAGDDAPWIVSVYGETPDDIKREAILAHYEAHHNSDYGFDSPEDFFAQTASFRAFVPGQPSVLWDADGVDLSSEEAAPFRGKVVVFVYTPSRHSDDPYVAALLVSKPEQLEEAARLDYCAQTGEEWDGVIVGVMRDAAGPLGWLMSGDELRDEDLQQILDSSPSHAELMARKP